MWQPAFFQWCIVLVRLWQELCCVLVVCKDSGFGVSEAMYMVSCLAVLSIFVFYNVTPGVACTGSDFANCVCSLRISGKKFHILTWL